MVMTPWLLLLFTIIKKAVCLSVISVVIPPLPNLLTDSLPRCPSSQQMPVLRYIKDRYYEPGAEDGEEILAETLDQCLSACAGTWNSQRRCQSVNYGKQTGSVCKLIYKSRGTDELSTSVHYDFYEYTCFKGNGEWGGASV